MKRELLQVTSSTRERHILPGISPYSRAVGMGVAGITDAGDGYLIERHDDPACQFIFCHSGAGRVWVDGGWKFCKPEMVYIMPPYVRHIYKTTPGERWGFSWVFYRVQANHPLRRVLTPRPALLAADSHPYRYALSGMYREMIGAHDPEALDLWSKTLYFHVLRLAGDAHLHDPLLKLWEAVDMDIAKPWRLEELAEIMEVSIETLRKLSIKHAGRAPMEQVSFLRFARAKLILRMRDEKISSLARALGYGSAYAFSKAFKRHARMTPAQYRELPEKREDAPRK